MNFILTTYIYPIKEEIQISKRFKFSLDNPRTNEEIKLVKAHLEKSLNSPEEFYKDRWSANLPVFLTEETKNFLSVESALINFEKNYSKSDKYVSIFFKHNKETNILEKLAKLWVIGRFDDNGQYESMKTTYQEMSEQQQRGFFMLDKGNPIINNSNNLINFSYLISLLLYTEKSDYYGKSFFLHDSDISSQELKIDRHLNLVVLNFGFISYSETINHKEDVWKSFSHIKENLIKIANNLDSVIDDSNEDKILFISNLLKVTSEEIKDSRFKLVTLISIIELLLTHSPNYQRFNVEDSISKQFKLKTSILVYKNNNKLDLNWLKNRLRDIYSQRSNIAHGNFKELDKYLEKEIKKLDPKENTLNLSNEVLKDTILENLISDVYLFIRAIIEEYIKDRKLVEYLKEN
ncbi:hypothetical protein C8N46_102456 [Kordia periserrulae]|uniref:Apea-like HEPN domain-containing protein n=1 Tax=Kordia periserrulae TaxID=701523 RepID=A0A2T6C433_9FLAO|nr:hypothetical protein [Kordia periserrulae]PTX63055.1 hypothetical protein C8N46_102456 [Kordia periserrulae]